jgi:hypothetical protein
MRTAIGATAVNIAKPTNLGVPMIHAFLDNIRYITIELNGLTCTTPATRCPATWTSGGRRADIDEYVRAPASSRER